MKSTYLRNCPKVKVTAEVLRILVQKQSLTFTLFAASFINDYLLQPMLHVSHPLLQFAGISSEHRCIVFQIL